MSFISVMENSISRIVLFSLFFLTQSTFAHAHTAATTTYDASSSQTLEAGDALRVTSDESFNDGLPFKVLIQQVDETGWDAEVEDHYWLMPNGNTTLNCTRAARYFIQDGKLHIAGKIISTDVGVLNMAFEPSLERGEITTRFFVSNGMLNWTNSHFTEGMAQFYKLPPGLLENAQILSKFVGSMRPKRGWTPITLNVKPSKFLLKGIFPKVLTYVELSIDTICGLLDDDDDSEITNSTEAESMDFSTQAENATIISSPSTSTRRSRPTSSSTSALSVDGRCGNFNGRTCLDSDFGDCCMSPFPFEVYL